MCADRARIPASCSRLDLPDDDAELDPWLNVPENAHALVGGGTAVGVDARRPCPKSAFGRLGSPAEDQSVMEYVIASYEAVPLLAEYSSRINPQQLKNALDRRTKSAPGGAADSEGRQALGRQSYAAAWRVASCRGADRAKVAGRFLRDFLRYHRDVRRLEALIPRSTAST